MGDFAVKAVSLDFHNTIAICDRWFELEINELAPSFLDWLAGWTGISIDCAMRQSGRAHYRTIRRQVIASGVEQDAAACLSAILNHLAIDAPGEDIDRGLEAIMHPALNEVRPVPGVVRLVHQLRELEIPLVVVSSAVYHPFLDWTLERFGVASSFQAVITSAASGIYKSSPDIYRLAAKRLGLSPAEIVHIGDSHRFDVLSANRAGMKTIWLRSGNANVSSEVANLTVRSLDHALPWLVNGSL